MISEDFPFAKKGSKYFVGHRNNADFTKLCLAPEKEQV